MWKQSIVAVIVVMVFIACKETEQVTVTPNEVVSVDTTASIEVAEGPRVEQPMHDALGKNDDELEQSLAAAQRIKTSTNRSKEKIKKQQRMQKNSEKHERAYQFENIEVEGYLDTPSPIYICDRDMSMSVPMAAPTSNYNTNEEYAEIVENGFHVVGDEPLSTFSIDVDGASFANVRRMINDGYLPHPNAVRVEEFINYFHYDYKNPTGIDPFSITTQMGACPWNSENKLVHIGLQGEKITMDNLPASNIVFLLDVSGSMSSPDKLPLLKKSLKMLVKNLRKEDRIAITVYAGAAGVVLESTPGNEESTIIDALDRLSAGGSTAGARGIELAYRVAKDNFIQGGNNRVILATDGDFNVGVSSDKGLVDLIEKKRDEGVFLTVLGFGTGNYKDSKMEQLANKGNGNYGYIDNILEAKKVLVEEMGGTLVTIAKDVKLQIEFNPAEVQAYRLIGYENRMLAKEDFNDDTKDAGELGAGHTVTALYEIVPVGATPLVDPLKYQTNVGKKGEATTAGPKGEILTVKFRYKKPDENTSKLLSRVLKIGKDSNSVDYAWSSAVAGFGMLLRNSKHTGTLTWDQVITLAKTGKGEDVGGYRSEAIRLMEQAQLLQ